jgi:hypothetical protein
MNKDHLEKWQQYQLSLSDPEVKMQAQAMIMHNNNEDFINSRLTEDADFSLTNAERDLRIKQLSFQSSQAEHWAFEALREARRSRHAAQATLGVVLSFAAMLIVIISFKL